MGLFGSECRDSTAIGEGCEREEGRDISHFPETCRAARSCSTAQTFEQGFARGILRHIQRKKEWLNKFGLTSRRQLSRRTIAVLIVCW
jgi:hypothetical protein